METTQQYLTAADLVGTTKTLTIESVSVINGVIIHWKEDEKPLRCNLTLAKLISKIANSDYIEDWIGAQVTLFAPILAM